MKTILFILLFAATSAIAADAKSSFDSQNYAAAARELEQQLSVEPPSAEGYYNLGLARERAGETTQAALNYQRALMLDPGLAVARNALATLGSAKGFPISPHSWTWEVSAIAHPDVLVVVGTTLIWIGAFGLLFATQMRRHRTLGNVWSSIALIVGGGVLASGWLTDARMATRLPAIVAFKDGVDMMASPATNSAPVATLPPGTALDVLSPRGTWSYVKLEGGTRGWVLTERLTPLVPGETL